MGAQQPLIVRLDNVELAEEKSGIARSDALRRVRTLLLIDPSKTRHGGGGRAIEVFTCSGERLCLKCMLPLGRVRTRVSGDRVRQLVEGRIARERLEAQVQELYPGIEGFADSRDKAADERYKFCPFALFISNKKCYNNMFGHRV